MKQAFKFILRTIFKIKCPICNNYLKPQSIHSKGYIEYKCNKCKKVFR